MILNPLTLTPIGIRRLGIVAVSPDAKSTPVPIAAALAELAHLGIRVLNPEAATDDLFVQWPTIRDTITEMRGGHVDMAPLFDGFPDRLPAFDNAGLRFLIGSLRLLTLSDNPFNVTFSDDDLRTARDFTDWGWWPASSVPQDVETARQAKAYQKLLPTDSRVEWINLRLVTPTEFETALLAYMDECAYSAASLRDAVAVELDTLIDTFGADRIDLDQVRFAEIRARFTANLFTTNAAKRLTNVDLSPDDILRMFAVITGGDVSLSNKVTAPKMTRAQRRLVLAALDRSPRVRDVFRRRGLWLTIAKALHVNEYQHLFPVAAATFDELHNAAHDHESTLSRFETLLNPIDGNDAVALLAREAPSVLIRNLRRIASVVDVGNLAKTVAKLNVPLRTILAADAQIVDNGATYPRLSVTKRGRAIVINRRPGHLALSTDDVNRLCYALGHTAVNVLSELPTWENERVWIDPATEDLLIPDQLRSTSDGLLTLDRGSRIPIGDGEVIRLFVYWREPAGQWSDLDLSCIVYDEHMNPVSQVSWTNLRNLGMTHSGDLTSAPDGAVEFIDLNLANAARQPGWRYIAPSIYVYSGPSFGQLPEAFSGWMIRDDCTSDRRTFDVKTVANAFPLTGSKGTAIPFVYDIVARKIVYLDVYENSRWGARTETSAGSTADIAATLLTRARIRPSIADLARLHAAGRGAVIAPDRDGATITVGIDDECTYNGLRPQGILADLL